MKRVVKIIRIVLVIFALTVVISICVSCGTNNKNVAPEVPEYSPQEPVDKKSDDDNPEHSHEYGDWIISTNPTCVFNGEEYRDCLVCKQGRQTRTIPALGHSLVHHDAHAPSCTEVGWTEYDTCTKCDYSTYTELPTSHQEVSVHAINPTCLEPGYTAGTKCGICGIVLSGIERIDPTGHSVVIDYYLPASCTATGLTQGTHCAICGLVLEEQDIIPATGHNFVVYDPGVEPTCTLHGTSPSEQCQNCYITRGGEDLLPIGHDFDENDCCKNCGEYKQDLEGYTFTLLENGTYRLDHHYVNTEEVVIPAKYKGIAVTAIGDVAFRDATLLSSLIIPDSIVSIGSEAFANCQNLKSIVIPKSVESISNHAFDNNNFESIIVDEENTVYHCANNCIIKTADKILLTGCKNSIIPSDGSVTYIEKFAFYGCDLSDVLIPNQVTGIGEWAFAYTSLSSVVIPGSISVIPNSAFINCYDLGSVTFENGIRTIGSSAFSGTAIDSIELPSSIRYISDWAFSYCNSLTSVVIPDNILDIAHHAFAYCDNLTSFTVGNGVIELSAGIFEGSNALETLYVSDNLMTITNYLFNAASSNSFVYATNLNYTVVDNCKYIGDGINEFKILIGVVDKTATDIIVHDGCRVIVDNVFDDMPNLTTITLPDSIISVGCTIFSSIDNLQYNVYGGVKYLGNATNPYVALVGVVDKASLAECVVQNGCKTIAYKAFYGCNNLTSITLTNTIKYIGAYAFEECDFSTISIPSSVDFIGNGAFAKCSNLHNLVLSVNINRVDGLVFLSCSQLESIQIPHDVIYVNVWAFAQSGMHLITYDGTIEEWNNIVDIEEWRNFGRQFTIRCSDGDITIE